MKSAIGLILPLALLLALFFGCSEDEETPGESPIVYTELSQDLATRTLTVIESPYLVTDTIRVLQGETVTIEPGVEIQFSGLYWLKVEGELQAVGNTSNPIVFTSNKSNPTFGDWRNVIFNNPDVQSQMSYCVVEYGALYDTSGVFYNYRGGISIVNSSPIIDHCVIYKVGYNGIYITEGSNPIIRNNVIVENDDNGIFCQPGCNPTIEYNNSWNNHSRDWVDVPAGIGEEVQLNINRDSCDVNYNISQNPLFLGVGDYHMHSCSPCIDAGDPSSTGDADGTISDMGVFYYHVDPNNIRKRTEGTLGINNSPYRVTCDAFVLPGASLIIEPGVEIRFEGLYGFTVFGSLDATGTAASPIVITTDQEDPPRGYWKYLTFDRQSSDNYLEYCMIDHGKAIVVDSTDLTVDHVMVRNMEEYGLHAINASPVVRDCEFTGAGLGCITFDSLATTDAEIKNTIIAGAEGRGISLNYYCSPTITNCLIINNGTSGIHCGSQSNAAIINNTIYGNGYYGVFCQWNSNPVLMNNIIANSDLYGINCQYSSFPAISYNDVWNNHLALPDSLSSQRINYNDCEAGTGDISENPLFVSAADEDFHLQAGSPCIDTGNPEDAYDDPDGSRNDMGAYGGAGGNW
ncbi:hypothetical protein AMJ86_10055 [bacterium SM23_57]|nr:MAG: hypothetical protein AMJ86_10055 [bacterium SM23_57]